jgi:hypothetical protein
MNYLRFEKLSCPAGFGVPGTGPMQATVAESCWKLDT